MAIFKCKMCGGNLEITDSSVAICEYCGTQQTVPAADDEKKLTLFGRANRLRAACEFDKAAGIYESIVADFPEEAEAYWGLVLCKYGIEYVDDPKSGKKIPTCHRSSFDSIMDDSDFEQTLENADSVARSVYREEAKQIEELRRGIIEVSSKEDPYDIFICYKETDDKGERTIDSVIAQDVYDALCEKGYRVFFSRITLEDKLGQEYEPYIFAALNSAKVMLAFGTDYEYYNAVWVKNEWSRFLQLIAAGQKKTLIPCYKGIDAYDMPSEFAKLQAQDMGKVGAIQDLLRGIEKIIHADKVIEKETVVVSGGAGINFKRAQMFMNEGNWEAADAWCERTLDQDPENAEVWLYKLMVELHVTDKKALENLGKPFDNSANYEQVMRYGDESLINEVGGYVNAIKERIRLAELEKKYNDQLKKYVELENHIDSIDIATLSPSDDSYDSDRVVNVMSTYVEKCTSLGKEFESISEYKDSAQKVEICYDWVEYLKAACTIAQIRSYHSVSSQKNDYQRSLRILNEIKVYDKANALREKCQKELEKISEIEEKQRIAAEKRKVAWKKARPYVFGAVAILVVIAILWAIVAPKVQPLIQDLRKYNAAVKSMKNGEYVEAIAEFEALGDYRDSKAKVEECNNAILDGKYDTATELMLNANYEEAIAAFEKIVEYKDSASKIADCNAAITENKYNDAIALISSKDYEEAIAAFKTLGDYKDSKTLIDECNAAITENKYNDAIALMNSKKYTSAINAFEALGDYKDSKAKVDECNAAILETKYSSALALVKYGNYDSAISAFKELGDYKNSKQLLNECYEHEYNIAIKYMNNGETFNAIATFVSLDSYKNSELYASNLLRKINASTISVDGSYAVGLKNNGAVVATYSNWAGESNVGSWSDIISVSNGSQHTVGLKSNGTVVAVGDNDDGECNVSSWSNIVAVSAGGSRTVGLKSDGTVVAVGWKSGRYFDVSGWSKIVSVSTGDYHIVGLTSNGTVVAAGYNNYGQSSVSGWRNIIAIDAGDSHTVGLKKDGTVVAVGLNGAGECNVSNWSKIIAVSAGSAHTVALRSDGTVVATGSNKYGQCNVSGWRNIVAVSAGFYHTIGLKADGTVVIAGGNYDDKCDVSGWRDIMLP